MKTLLRIIVILAVSSCGAFASNGDIYWDKQLLTASSRGDTATVKLALSKGADPDTRDRLGNSPLILAADGGYQEIVRLLLEKRASINAVNRFGYSALLSAVTNSHRDLATLLVRAGADPNIPNKFGTTARSYISALGFFTLEEYMGNKKPAITGIIDDREARRGAMAAAKSTPWREHFNKLISNGKSAAAAEYLVSIADKNNYEACFLLGTLLIERNNVAKGAEWLKKAAASNDKDILFEVGRTLLASDITADIPFAVNCLRTAMNRGSIPAKSEYAKCLFFGIGVQKNYTQSYKLFNEAAESGNSEALFFKGYMQYLGKGIEQNEQEGLATINMAADSGYAEAKTFMDRLSAENLIKYLADMKSGDRATVRVYMPSLNIPLVSFNESCDKYSFKGTFAKVYGLEEVDICYLGGENSRKIYRLGWAGDKEELEYLKNLAPDADFIVDEGR